MSNIETSIEAIDQEEPEVHPAMAGEKSNNEDMSSKDLVRGKRVAGLQRLLGQKTVMIPVIWGTKKPTADGWQMTSLDKMQDSHWLEQLEAGNIGVLLGGASGNLISIDCDSDDAFTEMARLNPWMKETLQSKGARGGNYWLRMEGDYPKSTVKLKDDCKQDMGEFRAKGAQTIISGLHPLGQMYRIVQEVCPLTVPFEKIDWPEQWNLPWRKTLCERIVEQEGDLLIPGSSGGIEINTPAWARLLHAVEMVTWDQGTASFRVYNSISGIWEKEGEPQLGARINRLIKGAADQTKVKSLVSKRRTGLNHEILSALKGIEAQNFKYEGPTCVCVQTGTLVIENAGRGHLTEFSPHYNLISALKVGFDRHAKCPRFLNEILNPVLDPAQIRTLQRYFGMVLIGQSNIYQKILILLGAAAGGKSILLEILEGMLGTENCAELRTKHLEGRFEVASFVRKSLLTGKDVSKDFFSETGAQRLKALTGGDWMEAEFKGESTKVPFQGKFNVVINCNGTPQLRLASDEDAWARRLVVVNYKRAMPVRPAPGVVRCLLESEGAGILNWAIEGYHHVIAAGNNDPFRELAAATDEVIRASDPLKFFVTNFIFRNESDTVTTEELFDAYAGMCEQRTWPALSEAQFHKAIAGVVSERFGVLKRHDIVRQGKDRNGFGKLSLDGGHADHVA